MTVLLVVLVTLAAAAPGAAWTSLVVRHERRRPSAEPQTDLEALLTARLLDRFVVTLVGGETFDGLLAGVDSRTVLLRDVTALGADGARAGVDGDLLLPRDRVAYLQRP